MSTKQMWYASLINLSLFLFVAECATPFLNTYLDERSQKSLHDVLIKALDSDELSAVHHGAAGLKLAGIPIKADKNKALCSIVRKVNGEELEQLYHAVNAADALKDCTLSIPNAKGTVEAVLKEDSPTSRNIYLALVVAEKLKLKINYDSFSEALTVALAKDDGASSLAYGLNAAALLDNTNAGKFFIRVEDLVGQADEVDGKYLHVRKDVTNFIGKFNNIKSLQLEGGLSITAFGVYGIYNLADKLNKSPSVKSDEAVKLANYLLSRKTVQLDRGAYLLLLTLKKLANNHFQIPVVFSLVSSVSLLDADKPLIIRVSNVLGESVGPLSVTLDTATHIASKEIVIVRQQLKRVASDKTNTLYEVYVRNAKQRGFYNLALTAGSQDKRLVGTNGASLVMKVLVKIRVEDVTVAVFDRELLKPSSSISVKESSKIGKTLEIDVHSKMEIRFKVKEAKTDEAILVHQAFVVFVHSNTRQEIIFVATPDHNHNYVFDVDFEKVAKDFEGLSGQYAVRLIIGDPAISHPLDWNLVDVNLKLPAIAASKIKKSELIIYKKAPEIEHMFREPEKRPPPIVSSVFIFLCAFPLLVVLILWLRIGINFGNLPTSPFVLLFHSGLIGIFGLYFVFWLRLTMFETLKYLSLIGTITFISGNRLLRIIAAKRK
uniref:Dolichyl-diphosphooligosaccharide--protein glycosyltransferase subunit 2 n=1 Tax=Elaeophora elaphi TaxID=1147741 RepID=A0A0R3RPL2_9BILA